MIRAKQKRMDWNAVKARLRAAQTALEQSSADDAARVQEIFHKRAERLASAGTRDQAGTATRVLVFRIGEEAYGVELQLVAQVFPDTPITPVPGAPQASLGIANLQGEVRSVFGLRRLLALPEGDDGAHRYILLLRREGRLVGLQIEHIEGVRQVALHDLIEHDDEYADGRGYVDGMTRDKVIMLRTDKLFER